MAFCGLSAPQRRLEEFDFAWNELLRKYGMPWLTMKRALKPTVALGRGLRAQSIADRNEALKPFADCIRDNMEFGVVVAVDVEGYATFGSEAKRKLGSNDPHYLAFMQGLVAVVKQIRSHDKVAFICDDSEETAWNCYKLYRKLRKYDDQVRDATIAITFADDKLFPALQAADLLSSLVRLEAYRIFCRRSYDYRPLYNYLTRPPERPIDFKWVIGTFSKEELVNMEMTLRAKAI